MMVTDSSSSEEERPLLLTSLVVPATLKTKRLARSITPVAPVTSAPPVTTMASTDDWEQRRVHLPSQFKVEARFYSPPTFPPPKRVWVVFSVSSASYGPTFPSQAPPMLQPESNWSKTPISPYLSHFIFTTTTPSCFSSHRLAYKRSSLLIS